MDRTGPTRRQVLAGATAGAVVAASGGFGRGRLGRVVETAYAAEPTKDAPLSDIEHVIFLMMENRSFDHYYGTYPGVRGFDDPHALPGVFRQRGYRPGHGPDKNGFLYPFHLDTKDLASYAECVDDITHNWGPMHDAWNHGRMDQWLPAHLKADGPTIGPISMGYYMREDIPLYHALADAFTLCDGYFASVLGPTDPNRVMWLSGTLDPEGTHGGPCLETLVSNRDSQFGKFSWRTMPENLTEAGVSWKVYQDASSLTLLNPLLYFKAFTDEGAYLARNASGLISYPANFAADVAAGTLPAVSWVFPTLPACDHPSTPPLLGEIFVAQLLQTVSANRALWEKTAIIVSYDENGGFFDHVAPPTPPPGTPGEFLTMAKLPADAESVRGPVGLGFRVPCLVLSPYSRGGFACGSVLDHTSQLKFLETRFGVEAPNISTWRRKTVGDLTEAFSFGRRPHADVPGLPVPTAEQAEVLAGECVVPPNWGLGVEDYGTTTPVPSHVSRPHQVNGHRRHPIHKR
jgi:phospholipase C